MLERALTQPQQCSVDPLDTAFNWGIPIWTTDRLQGYLDKVYATLSNINTLKNLNRIKSEKDLKVKELKKPYIKFESCKRDTRPVFLELPVWPTLNFDGEPGTCPFDKPRKIKEEEKKNNITNKKQEMTRKPRANTATRARRSEQLVGGFCEICRCDYKDLTKHVQSDKHLTFVRNDDNFLSLDSLINAGANVEAFLKLNQSDDVEKNLYTNGNDNLHNVIRNEGVNQTDKSDLADYGVDGLKMVQCNGARRKLNLNLSSPHNLRARAKHESGHLLRSKGSPWHEVDKSEKLFDKLERYTIKKRSKGTIWIEEDDPPDKCDDDSEDPLKDEKLTTAATVVEKSPLSELNDVRVKNKDSRDQSSKKNQQLSSSRGDERRNKKGILCPDRSISENNSKDSNNSNDDLLNQKKECPVRIITNNDSNKKSPGKDFRANGSSVKPIVLAQKPDSLVQTLDIRCSADNNKTNQSTTVDNNVNIDANDKSVKSTKICPSEDNDDSKEETNKTKCNRVNNSARRIAVRSSRGRRRQSVEERLIKDNRAFYKVEVIGNKLRSNTVHLNSNINDQSPPVVKEVQKEKEKEIKKDEGPSSEKPVVVRFKRVRKSELSLLSDEAESFMFGDSKRDSSDWNNDSRGNSSSSSVLPKDTESSEGDNKPSSSSIISSSPVTTVELPVNSPVKEEPPADDDSQDSSNVGRAKKKRRTQTEALIKDNSEYYKFETPVCRLRFQNGPSFITKPVDNPPEVSKCEQVTLGNEQTASIVSEVNAEGLQATTPTEEKLYPSKPSAEIEKMHFSFESVPKSEPWYQTYQRQDLGAEFWHSFSEPDSNKPFLLPYEIENFHENLLKLCQKTESRKRARNQGPHGLGRSPRKSPRCHASTLAIMSTIIRKREQQQQIQQEKQQQQLQQQSTNVSGSEDSRVDVNTVKSDAKSSTDFELKEIVKSIDDMLNAEISFDDSFEPDLGTISEGEEDRNENQDQQQLLIHQSIIPSEASGPPPNLLELLNNCHQRVNVFDNSSCASSECGEVVVESPLKRRKRRKNRTGWPGIKARKKLQCKQQPTPDVDSERENVPAKSTRTPNPNENENENENEDEEEEEEEDEDEDEEEEGAESRLNQEKIIERLQAPGTESADSSSHDSNISQPTKDKNLTELNESLLSQPSELDNNNKNPDEDNSNELVRKCNKEKNDEGNDENNHENVLKEQDSRASTKNKSKATRKRPQREVLDGRPSSSMTIESHPEIENHDNLCRQKTSSSVILRKNYSGGTTLSKRRQRENASESSGADGTAGGQVTEATRQNDDPSHREAASCKKKDSTSSPNKKKQALARPRSKKRPRRNRSTSEMSFDDENCKKVNDDDSDDEMDCPLSERVIPQQQIVVTAPELQQRRSSIEFQPVVRVMKIEDQVDMDHNILSVTVASNRRLRSSGSPKHRNSSPPAKRYKRSKGFISRWIKNS
ncbi:myb-like protein X isoform X2 [Cotesia glomerata]|nr:myb-like protein X isoform X2 [Cotesia glomerata]